MCQSEKCGNSTERSAICLSAMAVVIIKLQSFHFKKQTNRQAHTDDQLLKKLRHDKEFENTTVRIGLSSRTPFATSYISTVGQQSATEFKIPSNLSSRKN